MAVVEELSHSSNSPTEVFDDLFLSVSEGWTDRVIKLVCEEISQQAFANLSPSLLFKAASYGHHEVLDFLLSYGAIVESRNAQLMSALHIAAAGGFPMCISVLMARGGNINAVCADGRSPVYYATYNGHLETVKELIKNGGDVNIARHGGWTPLHEACRFGFHALAEHLIKCDAHIEAKTSDAWWTPSHMAACNGHVNCLKLLIDHGIDVNAGAGPEHHSTPLHECCYSGHHECIQLLLDSGADPTLADGNKEFPLHLAARRGHEKCVEVLVDCYRRQNLMNFVDAFPSLDLAAGLDVSEGYPYQIQKALNNPLHLAAAYGHVGCVEVLLINGAKHLTNGMGLSPIMLSTIRQHVSCIRAMIRIDPDLVQKSIGTDGYNPLHYLCMKTYNVSKKAIASACILLNSGADMNDAPEYDPRLCPLGLAARNGATELVRFLLLNGADPYASMPFTERILKTPKVGDCAWLIQEAKTQPRPLFVLARFVIRNHLGPKRLAEIFNLPLPLPFQNYLYHGHMPTDGLCDLDSE